MSTEAVALAPSEAGWLAALASSDVPLEIVDGRFVARRVGGNPHHRVARLLANEFERQWPDVVASAPGNWGLVGNPEALTVARIPDVLVNGPELLTEPVYYGPGLVAAEIWSPSNTLEEMNRKRREYRLAGLPVIVEVFITEAGEVHVEWHLNRGARWELVGHATGDQPLKVSEPRAFEVVPNTLLAR